MKGGDFIIIDKFEFRELIKNCIRDAYIDNVQEIKQTYNLEFFDSLHILARDCMNKNIKNKLNKDQFTIEKFKRSMHTFICIYDRYNKNIYSVMKQSRFEDLLTRKKDATIHYLQALASINSGKEPIQHQLNMYDIFNEDYFKDEERQKSIRYILSNLLNMEILSEVKAHKLITFNLVEHDILNIVEYELNSNFEIITEDIW